MNPSFQDVFPAAQSLPEADRVLLVDALITTLPTEEAAPLDDAWLAEIARRSDEFEAGAVQTIPWAEVKERARRRLQQSATSCI